MAIAMAISVPLWPNLATCGRVSALPLNHWLQGQAAGERPASGDGLPIARPEDVGMSTERLRRVREVVQRHIDAASISGAVTLVARQGRIVHFEAHGLRDVESREPMTKDTIFRLASMTKPVTGVAVLMMVEQGKIRLDDPLSRFIPEFKHMKVAPPRGSTGPIPLDCDRACLEQLIALQPMKMVPVDPVPASREITIRDLLTHTAGLVTVNGLRRATTGAALAVDANRHACLLHPTACRHSS
jgi:CubicO group peptidase (beta-lactamase class C family)